jgi:hypothetical protein
MEHCNGRTHVEMTDAYDCYSYPCPGPEQCASARARQQKEAATVTPTTSTPSDPQVALSVSIPVDTGGYTGQRDQWETGTQQMEVLVAGDRITLKGTGSTQSAISFSKAGLLAALKVREEYDAR